MNDGMESTTMTPEARELHRIADILERIARKLDELMCSSRTFTSTQELHRIADALESIDRRLETLDGTISAGLDGLGAVVGGIQ